MARFLIAHPHRLDDLVGAAGARGIVRAVQHEVPPRDVEQRSRIRRSVEHERAERFGAAFDRTFCRGRGLVDVDAVGRHAHQHVGARARAQLAAPCGQPFGRLSGEVFGQGGDREGVVALRGVGRRHRVPELGLGREVVGPVHQQERAAGERDRPELELVVARARNECLGVGWQLAPVRVRAVEVLRAHPRSVGRLPPERGACHGRRHTPPHHRVVQPGEAEDLRKLRDVTEHVREVRHRHGATELAGALEATLEVAHDGLARHHELVHEDHPRADLEAACVDQRRDARGGVGSDLEVVVDQRGLAVEQEPRVRRGRARAGRADRRRRVPAPGDRPGTARTTRGPSGCAGRSRPVSGSSPARSRPTPQGQPVTCSAPRCGSCLDLAALKGLPSQLPASRYRRVRGSTDHPVARWPQRSRCSWCTTGSATTSPVRARRRSAPRATGMSRGRRGARSRSGRSCDGASRVSSSCCTPRCCCSVSS